MRSEIKITNKKQIAIIDVEGVIGVPEQMQFEEVDGRIATYARFAASLAELRALNVSEVVVNIRSMGGDVNDALMIFDALRGLDAVVTTRCYGYVASAATIIAQAASVGRREISANALYLIHCSESAAEGNSRCLSATKELLEKTDWRIASIYAESSGNPEEEYIALMNENGGKGRWINAEEVVFAGLADSVIAAQVRNKVSGDELDELCRLFGLTPPELDDDALISRVAEGVKKESTQYSKEDLAEGVKGKFALRRLWQLLVAFVGGRDVESMPITLQMQSTEHELTRAKSEGVARSEVLIKKDAPSDIAILEETCVVPIVSGGSILPVNKIVVMERSTLQSEAFATTTIAVEDPSLEERRKSINQQAYEQDAMSLKSSI